VGKGSEVSAGPTPAGGVRRLNRPLDTVESIFYAYERAGAFFTVQRATLAGDFDERSLHLAARHLQQRHPVLGARVILEPGGPRWASPPEEGEPPLVVQEPGHDPAVLVEEELHRSPDLAREPPWRCRVVPPAAPGGPIEVVLTCSHAAADGRSASVVLLDLLEAWAAIREGRPLPAPRAPAPVLDDALQAHGLPAAVGHRVRRLLGRLRPRPTASLAAAGMSGGARQTKVAVGSLPPWLVERLLIRSRAERTTLTGALSAGLVAALPRNGSAGPVVTLSHAVSLRNLVRPPIAAEEVGCYVSMVPTRHEIPGSTPFWDEARRTVGEVRRILRRGDVTAGIRASRGKYWQIAESARAAAARAGQDGGRLGAVALSNRGRLPERALGPLRLTGWFSATSNHTVGNELQLSAGTAGGTLSFALVYVEPLVARAAAEGVLGTLLEILAAVA